jgi:hypothetical protein
MGVGLDRVAITKIENSTRCVFDYEVLALAAVLKVDVRWLLGLDEFPIESECEVSVLGNVRR